MNIIILATALAIGVIVWFVFGLFSAPKKASSCRSKECGYYDDMDSSSLDDHLCRNEKVTPDIFEKYRSSTLPCKFSSEFSGYLPREHKVWIKKRTRDSRKVMVSGILTVVLALVPQILKELNVEEQNPVKKPSEEETKLVQTPDDSLVTAKE